MRRLLQLAFAVGSMAAALVSCGTASRPVTSQTTAKPADAGGEATATSLTAASTSVPAHSVVASGAPGVPSEASNVPDAADPATAVATQMPNPANSNASDAAPAESVAATLDAAAPGNLGQALGAYPFTPSPATLGGTMTFKNVGAPGWWPRRLNGEMGDPACDVKDGTDTWGGRCCLGQHATASETLAPFDEELTLILKGIHVKQLAVYQPPGNAASASWQRVSAWDSRTRHSDNLWFTQQGDGSTEFPGDLTHNDCVGYLTQAPLLSCSDLDGYACPNDDGVMHHGFSGSKLFVLLGSMTFDDSGVQACDGEGAGHPGPWVAIVASELVRDGARKWNGECNCYSRTGSVGDGCGEMNVFEVVMDNNDYSNREFMSTGMRSYQAGHVGGAVCPADCDPVTFPDDADVVDACAKGGYDTGPELTFGGDTDGCPVWRRPVGDRYFLLLFDELERTVQVAIIHPSNLAESVADWLPELPFELGRSQIDAMLRMRLPM